MSDIEQRAAEVIRDDLVQPRFAQGTVTDRARGIAAALATAGLLANDDKPRRPTEAECDQHYQRVAIDVRAGCCGDTRKPCLYHDGYLTGLEAGLDYIAADDDDTAKYVALGRAVELVQAWVHDPPPGEHDGWSMCLDAIRREAEQQP